MSSYSTPFLVTSNDAFWVLNKLVYRYKMASLFSVCTTTAAAMNAVVMNASRRSSSLFSSSSKSSSSTTPSSMRSSSFPGTTLTSFKSSSSIKMEQNRRRRNASRLLVVTNMAAGDKVDDLNIKASETNVSETKLGGDVRQILGFKGASTEDVPVWKIHIQLTKPGTWVPLIWGVMCGAAASGHYEWNLDNIGKALLCMTMSGPFLTGYTQTINDWYDQILTNNIP